MTDDREDTTSFPPELVCPAVAADLAVFMLARDDEASYRKDAQNHLRLLLVKRGISPYRGHWALPGGFLRADETIEACALRETFEETGLRPQALIPTEVRSDLNRDPRGRVISHCFAAVCSGDDEPVLHGGTDTREARWFDVDLAEADDGRWMLRLVSGNTVITPMLTVCEERFHYRGFRVEDADGLAFDHAAIIAAALWELRSLSGSPEAMLDLLPEPFTLTSLQRVQETITGTSTGAANFRRKIADYVQETDRFTTGAGHRPARLYVKKKREERV